MWSSRLHEIRNLAEQEPLHGGSAVFVPLLLTLFVANAGAQEPMESRTVALLQTPGFQNGHWGILVVDGKTGKPLFERNADELFAPASVTKLFSTAAALAEPGADYRFKTPVVRRGEARREDGNLTRRS